MIRKILFLRDTLQITPWNRTSDSLYVEWIMHKIFSIDKSAQNVDFDNFEEGCNWTYYV